MIVSNLENELLKMGLQSDMIDLILPFSTLEIIPKNKVLVDAYSTIDSGYVVLDGAFIMQFVHPESREKRTVSFHLKDFQSFMAPAEAFFYGTMSMYQVKSIIPSKVLKILAKEYKTLLEEHFEFSKAVSKKLIEYMVYEDKIKTKLLTLSPEEFYKDLLANQPQIIKIFPSKYIAEFLGISREWLSKLRSKHKAF